MTTTTFPNSGVEFISKNEATHFWFRSRRNVIWNWLNEEKKLLVNSAENKSFRGLDIGCGTGFTAEFLTDRGIFTDGIEIHPGYFEKIQNVEKVDRRCADLMNFSPNQSYDFFLMLDVLEHIENETEFLFQAFKFLKPGGLAILTVPAFQFLWSEIDTFSGHYRRYTKQSVQQVISKLGPQIVVEKQRYYFGSTLALYWLSRRSKAYNEKKITRESELPLGLNSCLEALLTVERWGLKWGGLPFGSSLFVQVRKKDG